MDKRVTPAELSQATSNLTECLTRNGIRIVHSDPSHPGPSAILSTFDTASPAEHDRLTAVEQTCRAEVGAAEEVWVLQNEPSDDLKRRTERAFVDCARMAGVRMHQAATFDEVFRTYTARLDQLEQSGSDTAEAAALNACVRDVRIVLVTPLPGLREALDELDTETWRLG